MLSVKEVSSLFHVSQQTVRKWVRDGELRCFHIGDVVRFSEDHVKEFIKTNERQPA
jgi:excisionase family DNA binding protein